MKTVRVVQAEFMLRLISHKQQLHQRIQTVQQRLTETNATVVGFVFNWQLYIICSAKPSQKCFKVMFTAAKLGYILAKFFSGHQINMVKSLRRIVIMTVGK